MAWKDLFSWRGGAGARVGGDDANALLTRLLRMPPHEVRSAMTSLDLWKEVYGQSPTSSGVTVTWQTALEASVSFACARAIADGLSQIPFRMMVARKNRREPAKDHPVAPLLQFAPNEWQTSTEMMDQLGMHLVFAGNAYVLLLRGSGGEIIEMLPLDPSWVSVDLDTKMWRKEFKVTLPDRAEVVVPSADIWHLRGPSWNGWMGLEGVKLAREAIGLSVNQQTTAGTSIKNGVRMQGFLTTDQPLAKDQRDSLRQSWQENYAGAANSGKVGVLSNGMKFVQMSSTMEDAQFLEQRKFQVEEICRVFRVLPIMVGHTDKATTYASAQEMFLAHVVHTMSPWYTRIEASANVALLNDEERRAGHYTKFFNQALLRGAATDRAQYYAQLYNIGVMNPNEIRDLEDMNPYDGGERYAVPLNMVSPKLADEVQAEGNKPAPPAAADTQGSKK